MYQRQRLHRNVNRLIDTKGMNRISGKPLKTRGSGTLVVAGISCLLFGRFENLRQSAEGCSLLNPPQSKLYPLSRTNFLTPWALNTVVRENEHPIGRFEPSGQIK